MAEAVRRYAASVRCRGNRGLKPNGYDLTLATRGLTRSVTLSRPPTDFMTAVTSDQEATVLTIGHSTRPIDEFVRMLRAHDVRRLVDIRTVPGSRRNPQFGSDALANSLKAAGIEYIHMKALGGLRKPKADSINVGWRNAAFRGYADYMQTPEFDTALENLLELAREKRTAIMCAEAVPWRCHRSLVADVLIARGVPVEHIMNETRRDPHRMTPFAKRTGLRIVYPSEASEASLP
jgi:uncharacterized protein (DUF488 family)